MDKILDNLLRSRAELDAISLLGEDYDFKIDELGSLNSAAWHSCNKFVENAISKGASVNKEGANGTLLGIASSSGNLALVRYLIEHGADANQKDKYGYTALMCAANQGKLPVVKLLVESNSQLHGALSTAVERSYESIVKFLLDAGAPIDEIFDTVLQLPPLLIACFNGKKRGSKMAMLLLSRGADAKYVSSEGKTAIKCALWGACEDEVLIKLQEMGAPLPEEGFEIVRLV